MHTIGELRKFLALVPETADHWPVEVFCDRVETSVSVYAVELTAETEHYEPADFPHASTPAEIAQLIAAFTAGVLRYPALMLYEDQ